MKLFPVVRQSIIKAQEVGLGASRVPFRIVEAVLDLSSRPPRSISYEEDAGVDVVEPCLLKDCLGSGGSEEGSLSVGFPTPLRLRRQGKYLGKMDWPFFFATLARRLEALNILFHKDDLLGKETWKRLSDQFSRPGEIEGELHWQDRSRYSSRQKSTIPQGGLVGEVVFRSPEPWVFEWLRAAELVHVGKGASMGLGCVRIGAGKE
ncbi:MAG: CRISPR system precrRNA processing endoribonuclease RAMP protein Cas6 [Acidobacteriota bacterium]